jgi:hypothetical protein
MRGGARGTGAWGLAGDLHDAASAAGCASGAWGPSGPVPEGKPAGGFCARRFAAAASRLACRAVAMASFHGARVAASASIVARSSSLPGSPEGCGGGLSSGGMLCRRSTSSGGSRALRSIAAISTVPRRNRVRMWRSRVRIAAPNIPWMVRAERRRARPASVRGPVLRPPCIRQRVFPWMAGERQGQPARVRAPQRGESPRFGLPRRLVAGGGVGEGGCEEVADMRMRLLVEFIFVFYTNG